MIFWRGVGAMALAATMLTASIGHAESPPVSSERPWLRQPVQPRASGPAPSQVTMGRWLAVVLLMGLSGFALWRAAKRHKTIPAMARSRVQLGSLTRITPKAHLVVVTVNGRCMLLAVTEANISRLMWLDDEAADDDSDTLATPSIDVPHLPGASNQVTLGRERTAESGRGLKPTPANHRANRKTERATRTPSEPSAFREILTDIIGLEPKGQGKNHEMRSPAETLAAATEDRYVGRGSRRLNVGPAAHRGLPADTMLSCEGQAAGLVARLNRS